MDMKRVISIEDYHWRANNVYTPVYPFLSKKIIERFGIVEGICLDVGCCGGYFGISMATLTNLKIILMDIDDTALKIARAKVSENNLGDRIQVAFGDVHEIPLLDSSVNMVISRSSLQFWDDYTKAFGEIFRVLVPGGAAYIGSGFGNIEIKTEVGKTMREIDPLWGIAKDSNKPEDRVIKLEEAMDKNGICQYEIINDDGGVWLALRKPSIK